MKLEKKKSKKKLKGKLKKREAKLKKIREKTLAVETAIEHKNLQVIVFKLGGEEYGLQIEQIKEVVITPNITKVPLTPKYIKGVANIRGNILAIIDLERKFGLNKKKKEAKKNDEIAEGNYSLVVESPIYRMAILVKEVPNTLSVSEKEIDVSPDTIVGTNLEKNYVKGIIKLDEEKRLIILIDAYKIIEKEILKELTN